MKRLNFTIIIAASLLATALPAHADAGADVEARNVAFLLRFMGLESPPEGVVRVVDASGARDADAEDALRAAVARVGSVDLASLATSAGEMDLKAAIGEVWILETGSGECPEFSALPSPVPDAAAHEQMWLHSGGLGAAESYGKGVVMDVTTKYGFGGTYENGVTIVGQSDFFCIGLFGWYLFFPVLNGLVVER